jgi:hypothetical protein
MFRRKHTIQQTVAEMSHGRNLLREVAAVTTDIAKGCIGVKLLKTIHVFQAPPGLWRLPSALACRSSCPRWGVIRVRAAIRLLAGRRPKAWSPWPHQSPKSMRRAARSPHPRHSTPAYPRMPRRNATRPKSTRQSHWHVLPMRPSVHPRRSSTGRQSALSAHSRVPPTARPPARQYR